MRGLALGLATTGGVGYFPIAPGTAGSAAGVAIWWLVRQATASPVAELGVAAVVLVIGAWAATRAETLLGTTDPGPVVIDEVLGMLVTLVASPVSWRAALLGFVLFRVFDVVKPPPARQLERTHGGWGIMLDDLAAGGYAWIALQLALAWGPEWLR